MSPSDRGAPDADQERADRIIHSAERGPGPYTLFSVETLRVELARALAEERERCVISRHGSQPFPTLGQFLDDVEAQVAALPPEKQKQAVRICREVLVKYGLLHDFPLP